MNQLVGCTTLVLLVSSCGCMMIDSDPGPTQSSKEEIEAGNAEAVRAEIRMGAGELNIEGGGAKLLQAAFRYSESVGKPDVRYDLTGFRGRLTIDSPKKGSMHGKMTNEWNLRLGGKTPLDLAVHLGAGQAKLDASALPLRSMEVHMGAGEMELNVAGKYTKDVTIQVHGGVGQARIKLPKDIGAVVDAKGGIGSVSAEGLQKRDGRYYNDAYAEGKPAVRMEVRGGVGEIKLSVE